MKKMTFARGLSVLSLATIAQASVAAADDKVHCYTTAFSRDSLVSNLYVDTSNDVTIKLKVRGMPNTIFESLAGCLAEAAVLRCSVDCDGGRVTFVPTSEGMLFANFQHLRFQTINSHTSILDNNYDADGSDLSGTFLLEAMENQSACSELELPKEDARVLQAGDMSPDIEDIERALTTLGYPVANSSWVFNKQLESRTREFQADQKLKVTGNIDQATLDRITNMARGAGGGC